MMIMFGEKQTIRKLDRLCPLIASDNLIKYARLFTKELDKALNSQRSSLPAILNPVHRLSPAAGFGVAVSIGGTNGYVSAFRISKKKTVHFINRRLFSLPEETTKRDLFHLITKNILSVAGNRKKAYPIGIGFAYPLKPILHHRFIDGELLYMSKGRNIAGLIGKKVGQEYHKFLIKEYGIDTTVSLANDAICLLLGGDGADVAGVVGTGLNFAYWEKRKNISASKLSLLKRFSQNEVAVNIEAKNFDKIPKTKLLDVVDRASHDPGYSLAEKQSSGAYLYQIFNAGKEKILGKNFPDLDSSDQLSAILTDAFISPTPTAKKLPLQAKLFAQRILERSAQVVAIELCGILMKIGKTRGIVPIVMEGGIFWKAKNFPSLVNLYTNKILPEAIPSFARLFGSSRRGIAILAKSTV